MKQFFCAVCEGNSKRIKTLFLFLLLLIVGMSVYGVIRAGDNFTILQIEKETGEGFVQYSQFSLVQL